MVVGQLCLTEELPTRHSGDDQERPLDETSQRTWIQMILLWSGILSYYYVS